MFQKLYKISKTLQYLDIMFSVVILVVICKCHVAGKSKFLLSIVIQSEIFNHVILSLSLTESHHITHTFLQMFHLQSHEKDSLWYAKNRFLINFKIIPSNWVRICRTLRRNWIHETSNKKIKIIRLNETEFKDDYNFMTFYLK